MQTIDFIHPEDAAALEALQKIPVLPKVVKSFLDIGIEQLTTGLNMAMKVRLSPTQLPELYHILPPICELLDIKEPDFYLEMNPMPNAYAFGDTQTAITITSGLVEMMSMEELRGVVAHECGHIACHHMLYHTLAYMLANATGMIESLSSLAAPIHFALMYWSRKSELSCDRVAAFIVGPQTATSMLSRLAGGPKSITSKLNLVELAEQADLYDAFCKSGLWNKALQTYAVLNQSHPYTSVRVRELLKWTDTHQYKSLTSSKRICPHCHQAIDEDWRFCQHCGKKI
jgi:Zn-dependent protease with chaperone function